MGELSLITRAKFADIVGAGSIVTGLMLVLSSAMRDGQADSNLFKEPAYIGYRSRRP